MNRSIDYFFLPPSAFLRASLLAPLLIAGIVGMTGLAGCASGPSQADLLPDEGPTTLQVYERHMSGEPPDRVPSDDASEDGASQAQNVSAPRPLPAPIVMLQGVPIAPTADAGTRTGRGALADLQRDFQRLPNPEILGYVRAHRAGDLPVPGYYTVFPLRDKIEYAEPGEGVYPEVRP
ncbi:MAG: hypothetical protein KDI50_01680 [Candidatus Competibacteraceae bacterium]|nr:hypothetical protein [Candidatus Competibacteraceae bacterium]